MEYVEQLLEIYHKVWIFSGTAAMILLSVTLVMLVCFRIPEIIRKRRWIFVLVCVLVLQCSISYGLNVQANEVVTESGDEEQEEAEESKDVTAPEVSILWKDEQGNELELVSGYQTKEEITMELVILEAELDLEETKIYLETFDAVGQESAEKEVYGWEFQEETGIYRLELHIKKEANYYISAKIQDKTGNVPKKSEEGYMELGSFCLDRTAPEIPGQGGITWEAEHQTFLKKLINQVTFGYFFQPELRIKIQAEDGLSGVGGITYICEGMGGEEELEPFRITGKAEPGKDLTYEEENRKAYTVISIPLSFKGFIRARAWDCSGNLMEDWTQTKGLLIESEQMHKKTSYAKVFLEETEKGREGFYRDDVNLRFKMEDGFSGIRSVGLEAGNQKELLVFEEEGEEIQRTIEHVLTIPAAENNQNNISLSGCLTDFAGHTTELTEIPVIHIDTTPPKVKVEWSNQDVRNERYYCADQVARITVKERNFDPKRVEFQLMGMEEQTLVWSHQAGENCGGSSDPRDLSHSDNCTWTTELVFDKDGEYSFSFTCQDAAGNKGSYEKTETFVIDKTPPVLLVHWDDLEALNEYYYSKDRNAVLEIKERNFRPEDLVSFPNGTNKEETVSGPELGVLRQWEEDSFRAGINFCEDGRFRWEVRCTDLAGNEAIPYHSEEFVIDQTPPELVFENVADLSANRETVAPRLRCADTNFDSEQTLVNFTGSSGKGELPACARSSEENGFTILWGDFERLPENDDLYRIKAKVGDLAGNITEAELTFSVNRFGSVYELDEATNLLAGSGGSRYTSSEPELVITEYNPDFLNYYQVTSNREGEIVQLKEGRDYQVERRGTKSTWKTYRYQIGKENFQKEGIYLVTLYSEDQAKNTSNNRIKGKTLEFIVDKTGPGIVVTGVKDREHIQGKNLEIRAELRDEYALAGAQIYLNGQCVADYDGETLREADGILTYSASGAKNWQTFEIKAWDEAGNLTETDPICFLVTEQVRFRFPGDDEPKNIGAVLFVGLLILIGIGVVVATRRWYDNLKRRTGEMMK